MTAPTCPRLFEVEAARDGRLAGAELARFRSHLARCPSCRSEASALDSLGAALRELPAVEGDELHARRQRTRLLASFDGAIAPSHATRRWLAPLLAAAALTVLALTLWQARTAAPALPVAAREAIVIVPAPSTEWSRRVESHRETITLTSGTLSVAIDHQLSPRRIRVILPDGELEDLGTTFSVTVTGAATSHVSVQDGTVILRLRERAPIILGESESWSAAPAAVSSVAAASATPATAPAPAVTARAGAPAPAPPPRASASARASDDSAASDFRTASAALNAGDHALAASLFAAFLAQHPASARGEDAAYLRVIALQRAGNASAMSAAARDYLRRYPSGFRRSEVEALQRP